MPSSRKTVPNTSSASWKALFFHLGSLYVLVSAFQNLIHGSSVLAKFIQGQTGGWYQFLTVLGLCAAIITITLASLKDIFPSYRLLDIGKNTMGIISVPAEGLISVLYWGIRAYKPALMAPPDGKFIIPLALDLSLHAIPTLILWADFLFFSPPFSEKSRPLMLSVILTVAYTSWMEWCAKQNGNFPYPFLNFMTLVQRIMFYGTASVVNLILYKLANQIHIGVDQLLGKDTSRARLQARGKST